MPSGIKKEITLKKHTVISVLRKHNGVYLYACKDLNVDRKCLSLFVREDEELVKLVHELRHQYDEEMQDASVNVFKKLIEKVDEDPAHAFKSAQYYLNNKGRRRGFAHPGADEENEKMTAGQAMAVMKAVADEKAKLRREFGKKTIELAKEIARIKRKEKNARIKEAKPCKKK